MAKCSIIVEWDTEEDEMLIKRKLNDVSLEEVLDVLDVVKDSLLSEEWETYVIS